MIERISAPTVPQAVSHPARGAWRAVAIPWWECTFATLALFLCLDAGVRTVRLLSGRLDPIATLADNPIGNYAEGDTLTQALLFGVYLVSAVLLLIRPAGRLRVAAKPKLLWALIALALVSVTWSETPGVSLRRTIALIGSALIGVYLGTRYTRAGLLRVLLGVSLIAAPLSALIAVALPGYGIDATGAWWGAFDHKNHLGQFMALAAVLWLLHALSFRRYRPVALGMSVCCAALVALSHSATGIVLLAALLAVLAVVQVRRLDYRLRVLAVLAIVSVGGYIATQVGDDPQVVFNLLGRNATLTGRTQLWRLVRDMILDRLWLGYGYGGFWLGYDGPSAPVWLATGWFPPTAHNGFLDLLLDLGVVGLIVFTLTLLINARNALVLVRHEPVLDAAFPLIFLVFLVVSNLTESFLVTYNTLSWVLYVALTIQLALWMAERRRLPHMGTARARGS